MSPNHFIRSKRLEWAYEILQKGECQTVKEVAYNSFVISNHSPSQNAQSVGASSEKLRLLYPHPGWSEINPGELWQTVQNVAKRAIKGKKV